MERLDRVLAKRFPDVSRALLQKLVREGRVKVAGRPVKKPHQKIDPASEVECDFSVPGGFGAGRPAGPAGKNPVRIIFEDRDFFVVDKPAGMAVHPPAPAITVTEIFSVDGNFVKPVHRLDKDTSGVLVMAKSPFVHAKLAAQWKARAVKKTYTVLVKGIFENRRGRIEAPIARSFRDRKKMAVSRRPGSREAVTEFSVEKGFGEVSLLKAFPLTGRTHQIRVHFASIGHPVVGDVLYGDAKLNAHFRRKGGLGRQFLHASRLTFAHPTTKKRIVFTAELPEDLARALAALTPLPPRPRYKAGDVP